MALTALAAKAAGSTPRRRVMLLLAGVFGAAMFSGDSVITPAISVLSAVEGLEVVTPVLKPYVLPVSVTVLISLFAMQRYGTGAVGNGRTPARSTRWKRPVKSTTGCDHSWRSSSICSSARFPRVEKSSLSDSY